MYEKGYMLRQNKNEADKWYSKVIEAADSDDVTAQGLLGDMYRNGFGVEQDYQKALHWYSKAIEQGNTSAQYAAANMYENGIGVDKNIQEAIRRYNIAAAQGNTNAQISLGRLYAEGSDGLAQDYVEAAKWYCMADEYGDSSAIDKVRYHAERGDPDGLRFFTIIAEQGNAEARYWLGRIYEEGKNVAKDKDKAVEWNFKAAQVGNTDSKNSLYRLAERGLPSTVPAMIYFAERGEPEAQTIIGFDYLYGKNVEQNKEEAFKWLSQAAKQDNDTAKYLLGLMYYNGDAVEQNYIEAAKLFSAASMRGLIASFKAFDDPNIQFALGVMYRDAIDVEWNLTKASEYFSKAASQGHKEALAAIRQLAEKREASAQRIWGNYLRKGELVEKNNFEGIAWLLKAVRQGDEEAFYDIRNAAREGDSDAFEAIILLNTDKNIDYQIRNKAISEFTYLAEHGNSQALKLMRTLAEKGNPSIQYQMGYMYATGKGLPRDDQMAEYWLNKSAAQGINAAKLLLERRNFSHSRKRENAQLFKANGSIAGDKVNVRAAPNTSSRVVKQLNTGHPVSVSQKNGDWYFIKTASGTQGWVFGKYIKIK